MARFILTGDIIGAGKVSVIADNVKDAIEKAEKGDFERIVETSKPYGFKFDGDDDHVEKEEEK